MFLKLTCSHTRGVCAIWQWGTKPYKRTMINHLAWSVYSLRSWKSLPAVTGNAVQKVVLQLLPKLEEQWGLVGDID